MKGLYFASQYDAEWHNLKDFEHILSENKKSAMIGVKTDEGFRVDDEVDIFTNVCEKPTPSGVGWIAI